MTEERILNLLKEKNRKLYNLNLFLIVIIIIMVFFSIISLFQNDKEQITFSGKVQKTLNTLYIGYYPNEYAGCLYFKNNEVNSFYIPNIEYTNPNEISYSLCSTSADIHSHISGNKFLSSKDKSNLKIDEPECIQYGKDKISCYVLQELKIEYK